MLKNIVLCIYFKKLERMKCNMFFYLFKLVYVYILLFLSADSTSNTIFTPFTFRTQLLCVDYFY